MSEVKAEGGIKITKLDNGDFIAEPPLRRIVGALAIDALVNLASAAVVWEVVYRQSFGYSEKAWGMAVLAWILVPWIYGLFCFSGNTIGTLFMGTRIVKFKDGDAPGFWRAGWFMFFRTVIMVGAPIWAIIFLIGLFTGDGGNLSSVGGGSIPQHHISIDKRATAELRDSASELI